MSTIVFDFDGVIHSYTSGWQGVDVIPDKPIKGIKELIDLLRQQGYYISVVTTRAAEKEGFEAVWKYLKDNDIEVDSVQCDKPPALAYIDDRAIRFDGNCENLLNALRDTVLKTFYYPNNGEMILKGLNDGFGGGNG